MFLILLKMILLKYLHLLNKNIMKDSVFLHYNYILGPWGRECKAELYL